MDTTFSQTPATFFPLNEPPPHIKTRYARLALVTHEEQLDWIGTADEDTLLVSCDWLLWQKIANDGGHAVHFELGLLDWGPPQSALTELHLRANEWIYDDGEDMTVFRGVSLGKLYLPEVSFCLMNIERMTIALENLIDRFGPREVHYCDYANELNVLDDNMKALVARTVAEKCGLDFKDLRPAKCGPADHITEHPYLEQKRPWWVRLLISAYAMSLEVVTILRCAFKNRSKRVMVLINTNVSESLIRTFESATFTPIFRGLTIPKQIPLLWRCLTAGVILATPKESPLSKQHREELTSVKAKLMDTFAKRRNGKARLLDLYVQKQILDPLRFEEAAATILSAQRFIDRFRPRRIVLDGVKNRVPRIFAEAGRAQGAEIDYIWHSPMTPINIKVDSVGGDPKSPAIVTRCLTWGEANERWLDAVDGRQPRVRVGCPLGDRYHLDRKKAPAQPGRKRALILQYTPQWQDVSGLNTNIYEHFITVARKLRALGFEEIRMKLHPGPGRWKKEYFEDVADFFGLDCKVFKTEPFAPLVRWADIVIGPLPTGAFFETLAAGKPYYPFLMRPHLMDSSYYGDYPIFSTADELVEALQSGGIPDARDLFEDFYSIEQYPSPSRRFWEVMAEDFVQGEPAPHRKEIGK